MFEIVQLNFGRVVAPLDDAVMADFMNWLDEINALAERSPGFVWRLQGDSGNHTDLKVSDDPLFITGRCSSGGSSGSRGWAGRAPCSGGSSPARCQPPRMPSRDWIT